MPQRELHIIRDPEEDLILTVGDGALHIPSPHDMPVSPLHAIVTKTGLGEEIILQPETALPK
ncbi:MAG: hypothetical protein DRQ65_00880 [Gammaproteobacteria bacterium]|nr:MAG: hypothetical protein DRQ65_00880 [Gammaproteobacteria bacterium]